MKYNELLLNAINNEIKFLARIELINGAGAGVISNGERLCSMLCSVHQEATEISKASGDHSRKQV
jgi:hypothetical protein